EELSAVNQTIELNSLEYPVRVRVENANIRLQDGTGNGLNERLKSGEEVTISNSAINKLMVSGEIVPDKYALEQNYPNPFNPSTKIEFSIPEDVNNVTLTIFNALGQRVAELVNSKLEAGKYSYVWNASDVATGLYIYELRTDKFVSVKKMIFMK
ncbi:MAG: T9SS type A sorting domain-containing protein, partial [Saprospiraceae bacterium]|nr:T9SS type A sorting domain-containing protein [Saprospiraceae bacterium]